MNVPVPPLPKITPIVAACAIFLMAAAYMLFLYVSWQSYQNDRHSRDVKIDELLSRIPPRTANAHPNTNGD